MSLGSVNAAYKALVDKGLVVDGALSDAGFEALAPFKVDNAIILAAGLSSRFAPISYEKPKGLLHVRGEILIERQIRQLQESGIDDITVVAGYKKEYFFYLEEKHGVSIVVNEEYATRNNHSSLMVVRERLSNTSGDRPLARPRFAFERSEHREFVLRDQNGASFHGRFRRSRSCVEVHFLLHFKESERYVHLQFSTTKYEHIENALPVLGERASILRYPFDRL